MSEGFLSRWSKRKAEARRQDHDEQTEISAQSSKASPLLLAGTNAGSDETRDLSLREGGASASHANISESSETSVQLEELPTEEDLVAIEQGGDLKSFLRPEVSAELKNKAFKTLFGLPEFNVVDGMDVYMANYNEFKPLDSASIAKMTLAKQLLSRPDLEPDPAQDAMLQESDLQAESLQTDGDPSDADNLADQPDEQFVDPFDEPSLSILEGADAQTTTVDSGASSELQTSASKSGDIESQAIRRHMGDEPAA